MEQTIGVKDLYGTGDHWGPGFVWNNIRVGMVSKNANRLTVCN